MRHGSARSNPPRVRVNGIGNDPCDCTRAQAPRRTSHNVVHPPRAQAHPRHSCGSVTKTLHGIPPRKHTPGNTRPHAATGHAHGSIFRPTRPPPPQNRPSPSPSPSPHNHTMDSPPHYAQPARISFPRLRLRPPNRRLQGRTFVRSVLASLMGGWPGAYAVRRRTCPSSPLGSRCPST